MYVGVDIQLSNLEEGIRTQPGAVAILGDLVALNMPAGCANVVVSTKTLSHMTPTDQIKASENLAALVRDGGLLVLEMPDGAHVNAILDQIAPQFRKVRVTKYGSPLTLSMEPGLMRLGKSKLGRKLLRPFVKLMARLDPLICRIAGNPAHVYILMTGKTAKTDVASPTDGSIEIAPGIFSHTAA